MLRLATSCFVPVWGDGTATEITFSLRESPVQCSGFTPATIRQIDLPFAVGINASPISVTATLSNNRKNITLVFATAPPADAETQVNLRLLF